MKGSGDNDTATGIDELSIYSREFELEAPGDEVMEESHELHNTSDLTLLVTSDEDQGPTWDELLDQEGVAITKNQSCGLDESYKREVNTYGGSQVATE